MSYCGPVVNKMCSQSFSQSAGSFFSRIIRCAADRLRLRPSPPSPAGRHDEVLLLMSRVQFHRSHLVLHQGPFIMPLTHGPQSLSHPSVTSWRGTGPGQPLFASNPSPASDWSVSIYQDRNLYGRVVPSVDYSLWIVLFFLLLGIDLQGSGNNGDDELRFSRIEIRGSVSNVMDRLCCWDIWRVNCCNSHVGADENLDMWIPLCAC